MADLAAASSHVSKVNADMLATGKYSDLTIICQGERFKVHRAIVCLQSKPLAAAVDGKFKEAITGEIELDDGEPTVVKKFLEFLYLGNYTDSKPLSTTTNATGAQPKNVDDFISFDLSKNQIAERRKIHEASSSQTPVTEAQVLSVAIDDCPLLLDAKLYIMADRYDVQPLKVMAKSKFGKSVVKGWNNSGFITSLKLMYEETIESDRWLKDVAVETARDNVKALVHRGDFVSLCKSNGEIAFDVLKALLNSTIDACPRYGASHASYIERRGVEFYCSYCGEIVLSQIR